MMSEEKTYDVSDVLPVSNLDAGTSILVSGPARSGKTHLGTRILASASQNGEGALVITTDGNADRILETYRDEGGGDGGDGSLHFVDCSGSGVAPPSDLPSDRFETVSSPRDMTGVGVAFEKYSKKVGERVDGTRVMYDSLTTLLQYVDRQRAYRFLDVLTGRFSAEGNLSVFTVDGGTIDDKTSHMFMHEFDIEIRLRVEDGTHELSVRGHPETSEDWVTL